MAESMHIVHNYDDVIKKLERLARKLVRVKNQYSKLGTTIKEVNRSVGLNTRAINKNKTAFNTITASANRYNNALKRVIRSHGKLNATAVGGGGVGMSGATKGGAGAAGSGGFIMGALWKRFMALGALRYGTQFGVASVQRHANLEAMETAMKFSVGNDTLGSNFFSRAKDTAGKLGIAFQPSAEGLTKINAAMRGTSMGKKDALELYEGISKAIVTLGLNSEKAHGTYMAFEQIISKGKVSAEELRRQLGDRIPGAFQIAARAMGVTTTELDKMIRNGELMSEDFIPRMAKQLNNEFAEGWERASTTAQSALNRLTNEWVYFQDKVGESLVPVIGVLTSAVKGLGSALSKTKTFVGEVKDEFQKWKDFKISQGGNNLLSWMFSMYTVGSAMHDANAKIEEDKRRTYDDVHMDYFKKTASYAFPSVKHQRWFKGWASDGKFSEGEKKSGLALFVPLVSELDKEMEALAKDRVLYEKAGKLDKYNKLREELWGYKAMYSGYLSQMGFNAYGDPIDKEGKVIPKPTEEGEGSMADVMGGGNKILKVNIGNIIKENNNNFNAGDSIQNADEAERAKDVVVEALISTLRDLGQLM